MGTLPEPFAGWFARRGWTPRPHQLAMIAAAAGRAQRAAGRADRRRQDAGRLPRQPDRAGRASPRPGLHTLYVSPLKALATDIARNLLGPIEEMALDIAVETRTGDTPAEPAAAAEAGAAQPAADHAGEPGAAAVAGRRGRPCSPACRPSSSTRCTRWPAPSAATSWRWAWPGWRTLAPGLRRVGLSATVAHKQALLDYVGGDPELIEVAEGAPPVLSIMLPEERLPWSGHMGLASASRILERIRAAGMTIVFVNTRAQGELMFQALWRINAETLPIAVHHGSLDIDQRRRVEAAMAEGKLRAVVATSSLDLGIDWGGVDQVIQVGAPKGVSRLLQRVGRANHRMDEASNAILVPANRFELLECEAAIEGVAARRAGRRAAAARRARRAGPAPAADGGRRTVPPGRACSTKCARPRPTPR